MQVRMYLMPCDLTTSLAAETAPLPAPALPINCIRTFTTSKGWMKSQALIPDMPATRKVAPVGSFCGCATIAAAMVLKQQVESRCDFADQTGSLCCKHTARDEEVVYTASALHCELQQR
eukprot:5456-Heterococcus_DN1.PRE.3